MGPSCAIPTTHRRLDDAHRLWHQALQHYGDPDAFVTNLNAALSALRSVTLGLQSEKGQIPGFDAWYAAQRLALAADDKLRWLVEARNQVIHAADLELRSTVRAAVALRGRPYMHMETEIPVFASTEEIARLVAEDLPKPAPPCAALTIERTWIVPEFPSDEIMGLLAYGLGKLVPVVRDAHRLVAADCALPSPIRECGWRGEPPSSSGLLMCTVVTRDQRSVHIDVSQDEVLELAREKVAPAVETEASKAELAARYGAHLLENPGPPAKDLIELAERFKTHAEALLRHDGGHSDMMWLRNGDRMYRSNLPLDDPAGTAVVWRMVEDEARRLDADDGMFIGEGTATVVQSSVQRSGGSLNIVAVARDGRARGWSLLFTRDEDGTKVGKSWSEFDPSHFQFVLALRRVWSAGGRR